MCGLAGIVGAGSRSRELLAAMAGALVHRGPDDEGLWSDPDAPVGFAHRRLAIVDLSPAGHQPMHSADGRFTIAFNGEIYNHRDLRAELDRGTATAWRGHSDTETLVEAIAQWGLAETLRRAVGMFAIAVWDHGARRLTLVRDRFGEKPLYYGWVGGDFLFGSELKALRRHPRFDNEIERRTLPMLASRANVPAPFSIYRRIYKLEPGCLLSVGVDIARTPLAEPLRPGEQRDGAKMERYWSYAEVVADGLATPIDDPREALDGLEAVMRQAIAGQAVADVPVGAFLSGGIDSSLVTGLYHALFPGQVKSFTIGFAEDGYDEAVHARAVAAHFGTSHTEHYVTHAEAQAVIPALPSMYDEPFADSSQIPTFLVSRLARQQVTVALSGDGGDELFGGYNRYLAIARFWKHLEPWPRAARYAVGGAMAAFPPSVWNAAARLLPSGRRPRHLGTRVQKGFRTVRDAATFDDLASTFLDDWELKSPALAVAGAAPLTLDHGDSLGSGAPAVTRMMLRDALDYLPNDILCKVDRATMAVSLEGRVPFLDHRVAAFAARIPLSMKIGRGGGKLILRRLLARHLPPALFERPKAGFAIPVGEWLKGPLRPWAEDLLDAQRMRADGFFDAGMVQQRWQSHLAGRSDSTQALWSVLMFEAWRRDQRQA